MGCNCSGSSGSIRVARSANSTVVPTNQARRVKKRPVGQIARVVQPSNVAKNLPIVATRRRSAQTAGVRPARDINKK